MSLVPERRPIIQNSYPSTMKELTLLCWSRYVMLLCIQRELGVYYIWAGSFSQLWINYNQNFWSPRIPANRPCFEDISLQLEMYKPAFNHGILIPQFLILFVVFKTIVWTADTEGKSSNSNQHNIACKVFNATETIDGFALQIWFLFFYKIFGQNSDQNELQVVNEVFPPHIAKALLEGREVSKESWKMITILEVQVLTKF